MFAHGEDGHASGVCGIICGHPGQFAARDFGRDKGYDAGVYGGGGQIGQRLRDGFQRPDAAQIAQRRQQGDAGLGLAQAGPKVRKGDLRDVRKGLGQGGLWIVHSALQPVRLLCDQAGQIGAAPRRAADQITQGSGRPRRGGDRIARPIRVERARVVGDAVGKGHQFGFHLVGKGSDRVLFVQA